MSNDEAEAIQAYYEQTDAKQARRDFIRRMEHKLKRKGRYDLW